ncbi:L-lactate MFS transporter [Alkalicoccus chagannorensis]|uniref:L-lactate MFS transporter n=1 Tax=Alkalicoccus chagannorensis TaxID=427072 RepID=UPI00055275DE|nr:OFA family MFS transporter [Alkalicoccus chagannorensis]
MAVEATKNRWLIAAAAVGIHISIGSVYSWSVFTNPMNEAFGWSLTAISITFSIAIAFLGLSAAFMGHFVEKYGPRVSGLVSTGFFAAGMLGSGLAAQLESIWLMYVAYGALGGFGLGVGYITPVSTLVKWFPDRRGMATGLAIMGFGFASVIASPLIQNFIAMFGIAGTFFALGAIYFVVMLPSALYLERPPEGWKPQSMLDKEEEEGEEQGNQDLSYLSANESIKTRRFYLLWLMLFINVTCGIAILSVAGPMGEEIAGLSAAAAATMVGIMGFFNGAGRLAWASISDYIGRANVYTAFFVIQVVSFLVLPSITHALMFQAILFLIMTCYGGGFATVPAFIGDLFGTKQLGAIHGYILTAWAAAGLIGPVVVSWLREVTDSYVLTMYIFGGMFVVALAASLIIRIDMNRLRKENAEAAEKGNTSPAGN